MITINTIDSHAAGDPLRLIVEGFPRIEGTTMLERREWLRANHDEVRRALMLEPRGHVGMLGDRDIATSEIATSPIADYIADYRSAIADAESHLSILSPTRPSADRIRPS